MAPGRVARKIAVAAAVTRASSAGRPGRGGRAVRRGIRRLMAGEGINIPSSVWGKLKTNLLMWGLLPTFVALGGLWPRLGPALAGAGRLLVALGLVASYVSAFGYTRAFVGGYDGARG